MPQKTTLRLTGTVPMESWNMVAVRLLSKLRAEEDLSIGVNLSVSVDSDRLQTMEEEVRQALTDLKLNEQVRMSTDQQRWNTEVTLRPTSENEVEPS